jgi:hypothetical protein
MPKIDRLAGPIFNARIIVRPFEFLRQRDPSARAGAESKRQVQRPWGVATGRETIVPVELHRTFVLRIDDERICGVQAYARVLRLAAMISLPVSVLCVFARTGGELLAALAALQFATSIAVGVGPASVVPITPAHLRGRISAVYVFFVNLAGLGLGPVVIGSLSDNVFADAGGLLNSLVAFCALACAVGLGTLRKLRLDRAAV